MRSSVRSSFLICASLLLVPAVARPGAITVNGVCEQGNCASVDSVTYGQSTGQVPFSFSYTAGADVYQISGNYSASYDTNGTAFNVFIGATYTGSAATTSNDSFTVNVLQNFYDNTPGSWDGTYGTQYPLTVSGNVGSGSTITAQVLYDNQTTGVAGPFGPGSYNVTESAALSGLDGATLNADGQFVFDFAAGTQPGANIVTAAVPEPSEGLVVAGALLALLAFVWNRRKGQTAIAA